MKTTLSLARRLILALRPLPVRHRCTRRRSSRRTTSRPGGSARSTFPASTSPTASRSSSSADFIKANWTGNLFAFPVDADGTVLFDAEEWSGGAAAQVDAQDYDTGRNIVTMKKDGTKIPFRYASLESHQQDAFDGNDVKATADDQLHPRRPREREAARARSIGSARACWATSSIRGRSSSPMRPTRASTSAPTTGCCTRSTPIRATRSSRTSRRSSSTRWRRRTSRTSRRSRSIRTCTTTSSTPRPTRARSRSPAPTRRSWSAASAPAARACTRSTSPIRPRAPKRRPRARSSGRSRRRRSTTSATPPIPSSGYTYGIPVIAKLNDGTWAAIVGNGYNNKGDNQAVLYVINLMTGAKIAGIDHQPSAERRTATPTASPARRRSTPTSDGKVDYVYAGDINGNLWKFDIRNIASPVVTKLYTTSPAQPITGRPAVSLHPNGGYMVNFATGRMFTSADATDATTVYYAYGIRDNGTTIVDVQHREPDADRQDLDRAGVFNYAVRVSSSNAVNYARGDAEAGVEARAAGRRAGRRRRRPRHEQALRLRVDESDGRVRAGRPASSQPQGDNWLNEVDFTDRRRRQRARFRPRRQPHARRFRSRARRGRHRSAGRAHRDSRLALHRVRRDVAADRRPAEVAEPDLLQHQPGSGASRRRRPATPACRAGTSTSTSTTTSARSARPASAARRTRTSTSTTTSTT